MIQAACTNPPQLICMCQTRCAISKQPLITFIRARDAARRRGVGTNKPCPFGCSIDEMSSRVITQTTQRLNNLAQEDINVNLKRSSGQNSPSRWWKSEDEPVTSSIRTCNHVFRLHIPSAIAPKHGPSCETQTSTVRERAFSGPLQEKGSAKNCCLNEHLIRCKGSRAVSV